MNLKGFFPTYGGGHVKAVVPIVQRLTELSHTIEVLGLTNSVIELKKSSIDFKTISQYKKNYSNSEIHTIQELGAEVVSGVSEGINIDDAYWYHGVGLFELVNELGYESAINEYAKQGRKCFFPIDFARRILRTSNPDFIFVTCGQRLEKAFAAAANEMNIKVYRLIDLMSDSFKIDYKATFFVGNYLAKDKLLESNNEGNKIIVTGNPNFEYELSSNQIKVTSARTVTYFSQPGVEGRNQILYIFSNLSKKTVNTFFLYKPHPNENLSDLITTYEGVEFVNNINANELIAKSDLIITHFSSIGFQAINQDKRLITANFNLIKFPVNYKKMGCAKEVSTPLELEIMLLSYMENNLSFNHELSNYLNYKQPSDSCSLIVNAILHRS